VTAARTDSMRVDLFSSLEETKILWKFSGRMLEVFSKCDSVLYTVKFGITHDWVLNPAPVVKGITHHYALSRDMAQGA